MLLLKIEIIIFFLSFGYILFYFSDYFYEKYKLFQQKKKEKIEKIKERIEKRNKNENKEALTENSVKNGSKEEKYNPESSEKLREIIKRVQINISRGYLDSARTLIIEWLALSKNNKDLNLLLADVYEREKKYQNAEYIYRDLLDIHPEDDYILQRLWNIYSLRGKIEKAYSCYKNALSHDKANTEILDILAHLALELKKFKAALKYSTLYLKEKPRNAEKLSIKWYALEQLWKYADAKKSYNAVLDLQPYNTDIRERLEMIDGKMS